MSTDRSRRAILAFLLALMAATGMGLGATGVARIADGRGLLGAVLLTGGALLVVSAFRWLRGINARER